MKRAGRPHGPSHRRRRATTHFFRLAIGIALIASFWLLSSEPWGLGGLQLVVFMGPGALLGLGLGWMANATKPAAFTWRRGLTAAVRGAFIMPPVLAFLVGLDGNDRAPHLLAGFVRLAWLAFVMGGAVAVARLIRVQAIRERRHRRARRHTHLQHAG